MISSVDSIFFSNHIVVKNCHIAQRKFECMFLEMGSSSVDGGSKLRFENGYFIKIFFCTPKAEKSLSKLLLLSKKGGKSSSKHKTKAPLIIY